MKREEFITQSDTLTSQLDVPQNARSVIVKYGDKYGNYEINGTVYYLSNTNKWWKLKEYQSLKRQTPFICLTIDPDVHRKIRFNLSVIGGKFKSVNFSGKDCKKATSDEKRKIKEGEKKEKGFLDKLNDLVRSVALVWLLIVIAIVIVVLFLFFKL